MVNGVEVPVAAGASDTHELDAPVEDGDPVGIEVVVDGETIYTESYQADCEPDVDEPAASSSWVCGDESIVVTLDNSESTVANTFVVNGVEIWVGAGATETYDLDAPAEDGDPVAVTVVVDGEEILSESYEANCETDSECEDGETPGDGVNVCEGVLCDAGETPTDSGSNGVDDTCLPVECEEGETASDAGGNGVDDTCGTDGVECDADEEPADSDGDGVDDTCTEVLNSSVGGTSTPAPAVLSSGTGSLAFTGSSTLQVALVGFALLIIGFGTVALTRGRHEA